MLMTHEEIEIEDSLVREIATHIRKYATYMAGSNGYTQAVRASLIDAKIMMALNRNADPEFIESRINSLKRKLKAWRKRKAAL